jgi:hypothetical protein
MKQVLNIIIGGALVRGLENIHQTYKTTTFKIRKNL